MNKRILFLISGQHMKIAGGIGQFYRGLSEWATADGNFIDLGLDQNKTIDWAAGSKHICPPDSLGISEHAKMFPFQDGLNFWKVINFQKTILKAYSEHLYDLIIVNTPEAGYAAFNLGINQLVPIVYYTHQENYFRNPGQQIWTFTDEYVKLSTTDMFFAGGLAMLGTQTSEGVGRLLHSHPNASIKHLPFFVPASEMTISNDEGTGVLFIGRFEDRKRPKEFFNMLEATGLPGRVLTSKNSLEKFEAEAKRRNIKDFVVKADIFGKEKIAFINSCQAAYLPYVLESYSYSTFECAHRLHTFICNDSCWHSLWKDEPRVHIIAKDDYASILEWYKKPKDNVVDTYLKHNMKTRKVWSNLTLQMKEFPNRPSITKYRNEVCRHINEHPDRVVHIVDIPANRNHTSLAQLAPILSCPDLKVKQTAVSTLVTMTGDFDKSPEKSGFEEFF